jgi:hypothetical protein
MWLTTATRLSGTDASPKTKAKKQLHTTKI